MYYLDTCAWPVGGYPEKAVGMGGRQVSAGKEYANIYDQHTVVYEFPNGTRLVSNTRQQRKCWNKMSAQVHGTKGSANFSDARGNRLFLNAEDGGRNWTCTGKHKNMYQVERGRLFAAKPLNNGEYMAKSTLLAIMGRMATYTGRQVTWEQALASKEDLSPKKYEWGPIAMPEVALPGVTRLR